MNRSRSGASASLTSILSACQYAATRMSTHERHDARCGVRARCDSSTIWPRISLAACSRGPRSTIVASVASRLRSPMKTVAVIGSNSFSGSDYVDLLLETGGYRVLGISRSPEKSRTFLPYLARDDLSGFE